MAGSAKIVLRLNLRIFNNNFAKYSCKNGIRFLYSGNVLGLDKYAYFRSDIHKKFANVEESFRKKVSDSVNDDSSEIILTQDLKVMLHLLEKTPEDIELLLKMLKKFNQRDKTLRFDDFIFGPVIMRAFYYLDEPEVALSCFTNPELKGYFDQLLSRQILMDLLYNHKRYEDVKMVYDIIKPSFNSGKSSPMPLVLLVLAACYKQNTPESLKYALDLAECIIGQGTVLSRRAIAYIAALALNQNQPEIALKYIYLVQRQQYNSIKCIKAAAFAQLNRYNELTSILRQSIHNKKVWSKMDIYFQDTIAKIEESIAKIDLNENFELVDLLKEIKLNNAATQTLDEYLSTTISEFRKNEDSEGSLGVNTAQFKVGLKNIL